MTSSLAPRPGAISGWHALRALLSGRSLLAPLAALHADLGDIFRLPFPGFSPVVLAGPRAARLVLVEERHNFLSRLDADPIAHLLRHGVLVEDGAPHDALRGHLAPALHWRLMEQQVQAMAACVDEVGAGWQAGEVLDARAEMRRVALLALARCLFGVDMAPDLPQLWQPILRTLAYIAPGAWLLWPGAPRLGYGRALRQLDDYLYRLIAASREMAGSGEGLVALLVRDGLPTDLIRDQLLTLLIAGHDTAAASLTWGLNALSRHPAVLARAQAEVRAMLGQRSPEATDLGRLPYLEAVIREVLRLYPPIHVANRLAARDVMFAGRRIPAGARVLFSIFLTQRDSRYWLDPERFVPERFLSREPSVPFTYLPFGAGPRFCLGAAMAQVETKVILVRLLQIPTLRLLPAEPGLRMRATLEPARAVNFTT